MLIVVLIMTSYLSARLNYVQTGNLMCFTVSSSTQQYVYASAVTAAVFSGVSLLCVIIMMVAGLSDDNKEQEITGTSQVEVH
jgi:hypothetical protein